MADWNDALAVLARHPNILNWSTLPGAARAARAAVAVFGHGEVEIVVENGANDLWLQILAPISQTSDGTAWESAGWLMRDIPAAGLAQLGDGIAIRHAILLPHADIHAITKGIILTAVATYSLMRASAGGT